MKHLLWLRGLTSILILALGLAGCSLLFGPQPDRSKFFVLTAIPAGAQSTIGTQELVLGLGPIEFPDYLDRSAVVTRAAPNQLKVSEVDFWAEPLKANFERVLSENLTTLLGTGQIISYPWYSSTRLDYQVAINVDRFENDTEGNAHLLARWRILAPGTGKVLDHGDSDLTASAASGGTESAAALSRVLGDFSRKLATAVRWVHQTYPHG